MIVLFSDLAIYEQGRVTGTNDSLCGTHREDGRLYATTVSGLAIARQIIRSGTSPSANYRAACLAKSDKDFVNKMKMVEEELDETCHWLEIIMRSEIMPESRLKSLHQESSELLNIIAKSIITTRVRMNADEIAKSSNRKG